MTSGKGSRGGRGNPRFKGPGQQWKTAWRWRLPYQEMAFFEDFLVSGRSDGNYYESASATLEGAAAGFWIGAVVRLVDKDEARPYPVMRSGGNTQSDHGYYLNVIDPGPLDGQERIQVIFGTTDGSGFTEATSTLAWPGPGRVYRLMGVLQDDGDIVAYIEGFGGLPVATPGYQNGAPGVWVGVNFDILEDFFPTPNGIHGIVGGDGVPSNAEISAWTAAIEDEYQVGAIAGLTETGWRANYPILPHDAPTVVEPFVGAVDLNEAVVNVPEQLVVNSYSPTTFGFTAA